jgi:glycosyltransferase involved in cell wall biosynthesis
VEEKISAVLIAQNEERRIGSALDSVAWADEKLVVDGGSRDATIEICRERGARVEERPFSSYAEQKNFALDRASNDWVFSLDADERSSDVLSDEIQSLRRSGFTVSGYRIPRVNFYLGRFVRSTAWYPDHQLRLFDRRQGRWEGKYVHESARVEGPVGRLDGEILHHSYEDVNDHVERLNRYAELAARQMFEAGRTSSLSAAIFLPPLVFLKNYVVKSGFRDGSIGLVVSSMNAFYVYLKFIKLWELEKKARHQNFS